MFPMESDELNFGGEIEAQDVMGLAKGVLFSGAPPESGKGSGAAGEAGSKKTPTKAGKNAAPDDDLTLGDIELMHVSARTPPPAPPPISRLSMRRGGSLRLEELRPDSHRYLASSKGSSKKNPMQGSLYSMSSMGSMDGGGEDGNGNGGGDGSTGNSAAPEQMPLSRRNAAWRSDEPSPTVPRSASSIDFASASGSTRNSPVPGSPLSVGVSDTAAQTPGFLL